MRRLNKKYWPGMVKTNFISDIQDDAYLWCKKNMPGKDRWILAGPNNWYFSNEKDATIFMLKWGSEK